MFEVTCEFYKEKRMPGDRSGEGEDFEAMPDVALRQDGIVSY